MIKRQVKLLLCFLKQHCAAVDQVSTGGSVFGSVKLGANIGLLKVGCVQAGCVCVCVCVYTELGSN